MKILTSLSRKILPALFWLMLMLAFDTPAMTAATILAAILHELGHIGAAIAVGYGDVSLPRAALTGLRISTPALTSYRNEIIVAAGGPAINLIACASSAPFFSNDYFLAFGLINLLTAISNLLPVGDHDGYRIMRCALLQHTSPTTSERISCAVSLAVSATAVFTALFFMLRVGEGYWIFALFFAVMLKEAFKIQKCSKSENN